MNNVLKEINSDINCCYYKKNEDEPLGYCQFLTNVIGRLYQTNSVFCNLTCKKCGPYNNTDLTKEQEVEFIRKGWNRLFPILSGIAEKAFVNSNLNADIYIPEIYDDIKKNLDFLKEIDGFEKIYLTGSIILKNVRKPPKDIDIVLKFNSLEKYLNFKSKNLLPKKIKDIPVDYFIRIGIKNDNPEVYFVCLDVEEKILYTSKWFDLKLNSIEEGIQIVYQSSEYHKKLLESYIEKSKLSNLTLKLSWKEVENSWYDADSFIENIKSNNLDITSINSEEKVSDEIYNLRKISCFGDEFNTQCGFLNSSDYSEPYCNVCGCGQNKLTVLSTKNSKEYTKLHYPYLKCPLKKQGFYNYEKNNNIN